MEKERNAADEVSMEEEGREVLKEEEDTEEAAGPAGDAESSGTDGKAAETEEPSPEQEEPGEDGECPDPGEEQADPDGTEVPGEEDAGEDGRGRFLRRSRKKELAKKDEEIAAIKDRYMRTLAEYENFRRRTEKEKADLYSYAVKDVMTKLLPVLDNLERGLAAIPADAASDPIAEGMDKICKQFIKALDDIGVKPIEAEGKAFDPALHNAVMHVDDENFGDNTVAEELLKGYTYRDTVVRHSMVKVAN